MLIIAGKFEVDSSVEEKFRDSLDDLMSETREEAGCLEYSFTQDLSQTNLFHLFEVWESEDLLGKHLNSNHLASWYEEARKMKGFQKETLKYQISSAGPVQ